MEITEQNLEQLGLKLGQRKKILKMITNLRSQKPSGSKTSEQEDAWPMVVNACQNEDDFYLIAENKENNLLESSNLTLSFDNTTVNNGNNTQSSYQNDSLNYVVFEEPAYSVVSILLSDTLFICILNFVYLFVFFFFICYSGI